jgi:DNA-directed RNA polymerase subunit RPC12/RpoP
VGSVVKITVAVVAFLIIMRVGLAVLRGLARPVPEPPPAGELRRVKIAYRCSICGAEVRMTIAPNEDPAPPRHCQEDMDLMAPIE